MLLVFLSSFHPAQNNPEHPATRDSFASRENELRGGRGAIIPPCVNTNHSQVAVDTNQRKPPRFKIPHVKILFCEKTTEYQSLAESTRSPQKKMNFEEKLKWKL